MPQCARLCLALSVVMRCGLGCDSGSCDPELATTRGSYATMLQRHQDSKSHVNLRMRLSAGRGLRKQVADMMDYTQELTEMHLGGSLLDKTLVDELMKTIEDSLFVKLTEQTKNGQDLLDDAHASLKGLKLDADKINALVESLDAVKANATRDATLVDELTAKMHTQCGAIKLLQTHWTASYPTDCAGAALADAGDTYGDVIDSCEDWFNISAKNYSAALDKCEAVEQALVQAWNGFIVTRDKFWDASCTANSEGNQVCEAYSTSRAVKLRLYHNVTQTESNAMHYRRQEYAAGKMMLCMIDILGMDVYASNAKVAMSGCMTKDYDTSSMAVTHKSVPAVEKCPMADVVEPTRKLLLELGERTYPLTERGSSEVQHSPAETMEQLCSEGLAEPTVALALGNIAALAALDTGNVSSGGTVSLLSRGKS